MVVPRSLPGQSKSAPLTGQSPRTNRRFGTDPDGWSRCDQLPGSLLRLLSWRAIEPHRARSEHVRGRGPRRPAVAQCTPRERCAEPRVDSPPDRAFTGQSSLAEPRRTHASANTLRDMSPGVVSTTLLGRAFCGAEGLCSTQAGIAAVLVSIAVLRPDTIRTTPPENPVSVPESGIRLSVGSVSLRIPSSAGSASSSGSQRAWKTGSVSTPGVRGRAETAAQEGFVLRQAVCGCAAAHRARRRPGCQEVPRTSGDRFGGERQL